MQSHQIADILLELQSEIVLFGKATRPSPQQLDLIVTVIQSLQKVIKSVWPHAHAETFGSFGTGLSTQHSDIDLVIVGAGLRHVPRSKKSLIYTPDDQVVPLLTELSQTLESYEWCDSNIKVIKSTPIPVLKCTYLHLANMSNNKSTDRKQNVVEKIDIDISLQSSGHSGMEAREYICCRTKELPALAPLVLLLKSYLHHRNLSTPYCGGLSSYSLILLVITYLEKLADSDEAKIWRDTPTKDVCVGGPSSDHVHQVAHTVDALLSTWLQDSSGKLGSWLLGFLETFGSYNDLILHRIAPKSIYRPDNSGILKKGTDMLTANLWIDDPHRIDERNIGKPTYRIKDVQMAFTNMLNAMILPNYNAVNDVPWVASQLHCKNNRCREVEFLQILIRMRCRFTNHWISSKATNDKVQRDPVRSKKEPHTNHHICDDKQPIRPNQATPAIDSLSV